MSILEYQKMNKEELIKKVDKCRESHTQGQARYTASYMYNNLDEEELTSILTRLIYLRSLDNTAIITDWLNGY